MRLTPGQQEAFGEFSKWAVGLGILLVQLFVLSIPIILLTLLTLVVLAIPVIAIASVLGLLALPVVVLRRLLRRTRRGHLPERSAAYLDVLGNHRAPLIETLAAATDGANPRNASNDERREEQR
jgi:Flp pilus assembly protein TadB